MSALPKISLVTIVAFAAAGPNVAQAEVDPNLNFQGSDVHPYLRSSLGNPFGAKPDVWYSGQSFDCNKAGSATPTPLPRPAFSLSYTWNDWAAALGIGAAPPERRLRTDFSFYGGLNPDLFQIYLPDSIGDSEFPSVGSQHRGFGSDQGPIKGTTGANSDLEQAIKDMFPDETSRSGGSYLSAEVNAAIDEALWHMHRNQFSFGNYNSLNVETPRGSFPGSLGNYVNQQYDLGGTTYTSLLFPEQYTGDAIVALDNAGISNYFSNGCWNVQLPTDPNFERTGRHGGNSWGATLDDQWAIKRVGLTGDIDSAWNSVPADAKPVVVAVIDTGLDWHHLDIDPANIWRNTSEVPDNGVDDDQNGYIDDIIGWDFIGKSNRPWDFDGHGTLVTGIIAAAHNDAGIAGINPNARIMVLKAVGNFGTTRPSYIAEAIVFAVDNGAKVINISVGGAHANRMVQAAVDFARQQGVLVIAAAGNEGIELDDYGPAGGENVLTVGATHDDDRGTGFANYGDKVDIAAPGVDVLSLRARFTDANYRPGVEGNEGYAVGDNYVGDDKRYLRASGTSFSAPIVSGVASLLLSKNPELTAEQLQNILLQTAKDVDRKGNDKYTGHGMVDARAALEADADVSITANISRVELYPSDGPQYARVYGTVNASEFKRAWMQVGPGENPGGWRFVGQKRKYPIVDGVLGTFSLRNLTGYELWQVVINVEHKNGVIKRASFPIEVP